MEKGIYIRTQLGCIYKVHSVEFGGFTDFGPDDEDIFWEHFDDEDLHLVEGFRQIEGDVFDSYISYVPKWAIESIDIIRED